jgi:hypothetical protein
VGDGVGNLHTTVDNRAEKVPLHVK